MHELSALPLLFVATYLVIASFRQIHRYLDWGQRVERPTTFRGFFAWTRGYIAFRWRNRHCESGVIYSLAEIARLRSTRRSLRSEALGVLRFLGFVR